MAVEYFTSEADPFAVIYEVDFGLGTCRVYGCEDSPTSRLVDEGRSFRKVEYVPLAKHKADDGVIFERLDSLTIH